MTLIFSIICYSLANGAIITEFTCEVLVFLSNEHMFFFNVSRERAIERKYVYIPRKYRRNCIVLLNYNYLIIILFYFGFIFSIIFSGVRILRVRILGLRILRVPTPQSAVRSPQSAFLPRPSATVKTVSF